jgi:hypothetical protein
MLKVQGNTRHYNSFHKGASGDYAKCLKKDATLSHLGETKPHIPAL